MQNTTHTTRLRTSRRILTFAAALCLTGSLSLAAADGGETAVAVSVSPSEQEQALDGIVIVSLPEDGTLMCAQRALLRGEGVAAERLGSLRWISDGEDADAVFTYLPVYEDGTMGEETSCTLPAAAGSVPTLAPADNASPIACELAVTTYRDIAAAGVLSGLDPDGDVLHCKLQELPQKGVVTLAEDGMHFVYTPYRLETGRDTFTFVTVDAFGAVSPPAEVTVTIEKPRTGLMYSDMGGNAAHYAAIRLAEEGIYTGTCIGGRWYLEPDKTVSRGEFLALAVAVSGHEMVPAVNTSYADDEAIPTWVKPFAVTALQAGIARGMDTDAGRILEANEPITRAEAAVMLNAAAGLQDAAAGIDEAVPAWAQEACRNADTLGVLSTGNAEDTLTRAETVQAVYNAWCYAQDVQETGSFFSWLS